MCEKKKKKIVDNKKNKKQKSTITSQTAETHRACGKPFRPSLTTSPRHRPVMMTHPSQMHLNHFYSRFEMQNDTPAQKLPTPPNDQALCLSPADVKNTLSRINPRKAAGPDNIPGHVLKDCAAQLTDVLTDIFNTSLNQAVIPTCLKSTTIIPVPKKSPVSCLNDYHPIALTPIIRGGNLLESLDSIRIDSWGHNLIKNRFTIVSIHDSKSILDSKTILQFESNFDLIYIIYLYFIPVCGLVLLFCSYLTVMDSPKEIKIPLHQKPEIYFVSFSCTLNNLV